MASESQENVGSTALDGTEQGDFSETSEHVVLPEERKCNNMLMFTLPQKH